MSHPSVGGFARSKSSGTFLKLFIPTAPSLRGDTVLSFAFRNPLRLLRPVPWTLARGGFHSATLATFRPLAAVPLAATLTSLPRPLRGNPPPPPGPRRRARPPRGGSRGSCGRPRPAPGRGAPAARPPPGGRGPSPQTTRPGRGGFRPLPG